MRLPSLRTWPMPLAVGEDTYQEFTAGTIPVRRVMTDDPASLVLVEHERGFMPVFDEHLDAVRRAAAPMENVDYVATWTGMTGGATRPTVIRLELKIDGLRARPRLLFTGHAMTPLWLFADGAWLGLVLHPSGDGPSSSLVGIGCSARPPSQAASVESGRRPGCLARRRSRDRRPGDAGPRREPGNARPATANRVRALGNADNGTRRVQTSRNETEGDDHA